MTRTQFGTLTIASSETTSKSNEASRSSSRALEPTEHALSSKFRVTSATNVRSDIDFGTIPVRDPLVFSKREVHAQSRVFARFLRARLPFAFAESMATETFDRNAKDVDLRTSKPEIGLPPDSFFHLQASTSIPIPRP